MRRDLSRTNKKVLSNRRNCSRLISIYLRGRCQMLLKSSVTSVTSLLPACLAGVKAWRAHLYRVAYVNPYGRWRPAALRLVPVKSFTHIKPFQIIAACLHQLSSLLYSVFYLHVCKSVPIATWNTPLISVSLDFNQTLTFLLFPIRYHVQCLHSDICRMDTLLFTLLN